VLWTTSHTAFLALVYRLNNPYRSRALVAALLAFLVLPAVAGEATVAAASSLRFALEEIVARFSAATGREVRVSYGASGDLVRQIAQGAPFELFLSADEDYVYQLHAQGLALDRGSLYALGRIVLFAPRDSPLGRASFESLREAERSGKVSRFVIPNPEHAPYGRAAREVLRHEGLWEALQPHLVMGENAAQALYYATSGATQGGILPLSLVTPPELAGRGAYTLIRSELHAPIRHRMVLLADAGATARRFYVYLQSPDLYEIFERHGFNPP
jgi:molybdate transport system substrate-binding protein